MIFGRQSESVIEGYVKGYQIRNETTGYQVWTFRLEIVDEDGNRAIFGAGRNEGHVIHGFYQ